MPVIDDIPTLREQLIFLDKQRATLGIRRQDWCKKAGKPESTLYRNLKPKSMPTEAVVAEFANALRRMERGRK